MDIHRFLAENEIAIYVAFDASDQSYTIVKNQAAALSYYSLFNQLVIQGDDAYWPSVRNQPLLPQMWAQGTVRCCVFPVSPEKTVALFFEWSCDRQEISSRCHALMKQLQEAYDNVSYPVG